MIIFTWSIVFLLFRMNPSMGALFEYHMFEFRLSNTTEAAKTPAPCYSSPGLNGLTLLQWKYKHQIKCLPDTNICCVPASSNEIGVRTTFPCRRLFMRLELNHRAPPPCKTQHESVDMWLYSGGFLYFSEFQLCLSVAGVSKVFGFPFVCARVVGPADRHVVLVSALLVAGRRSQVCWEVTTGDWQAHF